MERRIVYVFDCPVHGEEDNVFCFRAYDENLKGRWKKLEVFAREVPISDEERDSMLARFKGTYATASTIVPMPNIHGIDSPRRE